MSDIRIVGLGISSIQQITREADDAIRSSNEVFYLDTGVATRQFMEERCDRVTSLYEESYVEGGHRLNAYYHMAAAVIDAAISRAPVTLAIHGHPLVAAYAPFLVCDLARVLGLSVEILPGVSAMDTILAELQVDPCIEGIQMYEATDLMLRRRPLQPDVPALIWQIGNLESRLHTMRVSRPERFHGFVEYLQQFYAPNHKVIAIYTSPHPLVPADVLRFPLSEMPEHADRIHTGFSLYIPTQGQRPIQDPNLLQKIDSPEHLDRMTRSPSNRT